MTQSYPIIAEIIISINQKPRDVRDGNVLRSFLAKLNRLAEDLWGAIENKKNHFQHDLSRCQQQARPLSEAQQTFE